MSIKIKQTKYNVLKIIKKLDDFLYEMGEKIL